MADTPLRSAYAQLTAGETQLGGGFVQGELGARLAQGLSFFGQGGFERDTGWGAMAGVRYEF